MFGERRHHKCEARLYAFNEASPALHVREPGDGGCGGHDGLRTDVSHDDVLLA
jgi:hypothetical protein